MSLFYGHEATSGLPQDQVTEIVKIELDKHDKVHQHQTIFDFNVTRAKLVGSDLLKGYLKDDQGLAHSILSCVPLTGQVPNVSPPQDLSPPLPLPG